ncbi:MAG: segregation/condensation protein A [Clostridia bacterium]|nr:segregation/condensation protein A [Clostridia bacterium]
MAYIVSLKQFDGPLDLLLTLISEAKLDIQDIFVSEITEQYLQAMELVDELDMDSASEFLQMAATLLEIKSRAMLPKPPKPEAEDELSPEDALIRQLTEYKQFKEASARMHTLEEEARALMTKLPEEYPLPPPNIEITGLTLDKLMRAFRRVLERAEARDRADVMAGREIRRDRFTVSGCMSRIARRLRKGAFRFTDLFEEDMSRAEVITMFMALLEMARLSRVHIAQETAYGEILLDEPKEPSATEPVVSEEENEG